MPSTAEAISNALLAETSRRRFAMQLGLGSAVLLLAACGGGGGSGLVEDDSSSNDDTARLRRAYDQLQPGMTSDDVITLVGRPPDDGKTSMVWRATGGFLIVNYSPGAVLVVSSAGWGSAKEDLSKSLL